MLELGSAGDEEALEQVAAVELERLRVAPGVECLVEGVRIAPDLGFGEPHSIIATARERVVAERLPEAVDRLAKRGACVRQVALRPKEGEQ